MNQYELLDLERQISRHNVDCCDAISLFDCVLASLGRNHDDLTEVEHHYQRLLVAIGKLDNPQAKRDEMDLARDYLLSKDEA